MRTGTPFLIAGNDRGCIELTKGKITGSFENTPEGRALRERFMEVLAVFNLTGVKVNDGSPENKRYDLLYLYIEDKTNKKHNI